MNRLPEMLTISNKMKKQNKKKNKNRIYGIEIIMHNRSDEEQTGPLINSGASGVCVVMSSAQDGRQPEYFLPQLHPS